MHKQIVKISLIKSIEKLPPILYNIFTPKFSLAFLRISIYQDKYRKIKRAKSEACLV